MKHSERVAMLGRLGMTLKQRERFWGGGGENVSFVRSGRSDQENLNQEATLSTDGQYTIKRVLRTRRHKSPGSRPSKQFPKAKEKGKSKDGFPEVEEGE